MQLLAEIAMSLLVGVGVTVFLIATSFLLYEIALVIVSEASEFFMKRRRRDARKRREELYYDARN